MFKCESFSARNQRKRKFCTSSWIFGDDHCECSYKHAKYHWRATHSRKYTIIGDSLIKNIKQLRFTEVQAFPGANTNTLYRKLGRSDDVQLDFDIVVVAIGTNDIENRIISPERHAQEISEVIRLILRENPACKLGISEIVPRLCDSDELNRRVIEFNRAVKQICKHFRKDENRKVWYLSTSARFLKNGTLISNLFERDGLHLSCRGQQVLQEILVGHIKRLQGY